MLNTIPDNTDVVVYQVGDYRVVAHRSSNALYSVYSVQQNINGNWTHIRDFNYDFSAKNFVNKQVPAGTPITDVPGYIPTMEM